MQPGRRRTQLNATLQAAYSEGLLSHDTFVHRIGRLLTTGAVNSDQLVGDLTLRPRATPARSAVRHQLMWMIGRLRGTGADPLVPLLALDWTGDPQPLLIGRSEACDVRLTDPAVSRLHARLLFRDGVWVVQDLGSKNGTLLNGVPVGRGQLHPGDLIAFAQQRFCID